MSDLVYKIFRPQEWAEAEKAGVFLGSPDDRRDGFVHFSSAGQVRGTVARHFAGEGALILVAVSAAALGEALKWDVSRGGEKFPHLYGPLPLVAVTSVTGLERGSDVTFCFPAAIP